MEIQKKYMCNLCCRCIVEAEYITQKSSCGVQDGEEAHSNKNDGELKYHVQHDVFTCACGRMLSNEDMCNILVERIKVVRCQGGCEPCIKMGNEKDYENQWSEDFDGYIVCTFCQMKCEYGLPKNCECYGYISRSGEILCKNCGIALDDVGKYCC